MKLVPPTKKDIERYSRVVNLIDLELYDQDWVIITDNGMIKPKRTTPEKHKELLEFGMEAIKQRPEGMVDL